MTNNFPRGIEVVGSVIVENKRGEILLTKSPAWPNKWMMPGGHIEPGETIIAGLLREAEEEAGLKLQAIEIFYSGELIGSPDFKRSAHFIYFDLFCKLVNNQQVKLDRKELTEYIWVKPAEALKMNLSGSYDKVITAFIKYKLSH